MTNQNIIQSLRTLLQSSDLASKKWVSGQYDSGVMNDTLAIGGDAAVVRVRDTQKALAITSDCTPRYVEADPFEGAKQAVVETYRNISSVGGTPLAITNCLNFGNPQKPEIMGQIVRAIKGINEACKALDYPVVSGNVSLYNETDGRAIQPTPAIGGVGLLKDLTQRVNTKFKNIDDVVLVIGKTVGHLNCSLFEREILKSPSKKNPPKVDLKLEKQHGELVRNLIKDKLINACHDVSDGGILVTLFEMGSKKLGVQIDDKFLENSNDQNALLFGEDQGRYVITTSPLKVKQIIALSVDIGVEIFSVGQVIAEQISVANNNIKIQELQDLNESIFPAKFS
ncbi:MAG: phosphoribosylformylglycinamidine synthase [Myxococcota bacterium]|jgi:phosphoribosylformylglycinamidine synthase